MGLAFPNNTKYNYVINDGPIKISNIFGMGIKGTPDCGSTYVANMEIDYDNQVEYGIAPSLLRSMMTLQYSPGSLVSSTFYIAA
jgi:hypothetical protein